MVQKKLSNLILTGRENGKQIISKIDKKTLEKAREFKLK